MRLCGSTLGRWIGLSSKTQPILTQVKSICTHANTETAGNWRLKNYCYFGCCEDAISLIECDCDSGGRVGKEDEAATLIPSPGMLHKIATTPEKLSEQQGWWKVLSIDVLDSALSGANTTHAEVS